VTSFSLGMGKIFCWRLPG